MTAMLQNERRMYCIQKALRAKADLTSDFWTLMSELLPANLPAFVLFFEPGHQRLEIFHHRASGDVFSRRFL